MAAEPEPKPELDAAIGDGDAEKSAPTTPPPKATRRKDGLIVLHTGNGKGKTTAALGLALRALGHGMDVCMIQFIKGKWSCGEHEAAKVFGERFEIHPVGDGFTWDTKNRAQDIARVREGWELAMDKVRSGRFRMLILDEINYVLSYGYMEAREVLEFLATKPASLHVVLTGRNPPPELLEAADLVTEMVKVKHPYEAGIKAQKGIEF
ncbi:MAG: cob(I)yrinic acid a,c-diamide adenosyltransferase [Nitrospirota bacterium]|nr:cob(I)yrinic acid a,c-diamide adenosyltransferase [Nitrospirota bacterium]